MTARQDIIRSLSEKPMTVRQISRSLGIEPNDVIEDLRHISKSLLPKRRLVREHSVCLSCGFVFRDRLRFTSPSRCPKCKGESITETRFRVESKESKHC